MNDEAEHGLLVRGRCRPLPQAHADSLQCGTGDNLLVARSILGDCKTHRTHVVFLRLNEGVADLIPIDGGELLAQMIYVSGTALREELAIVIDEAVLIEKLVQGSTQRELDLPPGQQVQQRERIVEQRQVHHRARPDARDDLGVGVLRDAMHKS